MCKCGHSTAQHWLSLYGPLCQGTTNHDGAFTRCACSEFEPAVSQVAPDAAPWGEA